MTFNNANRKNIREAEKAAHLAESNRIAYTRQIMFTAPGRAWLYDLLLRCNVFHTPFVKDSPDATAFNCGGQNIGLRLFGDVAAHSPHEYSLMMQEASIKDLANAYRNESSNDTDGAESTEPGRDDTEPSSTGGDTTDYDNIYRDAPASPVRN